MDDPIRQRVLRELPSDTPMDLIEHFVKIDKMLDEAKYALAEKKFEEEKERKLQEKALQEVESGKSSALSGKSRRSQKHRALKR